MDDEVVEELAFADSYGRRVLDLSRKTLLESFRTIDSVGRSREHNSRTQLLLLLAALTTRSWVSDCANCLWSSAPPRSVVAVPNQMLCAACPLAIARSLTYLLIRVANDKVVRGRRR